MMLRNFLKIITLLCVLFIFVIPYSGISAYTNPVTLEDQWEKDGIGDPFVLKHNGKFYLYSSTGQSNVGFKCWSSTDIVNWEYEGLCATDPVTRDGYAPEVVYWNGTFYMYTSPWGRGHYVLTSDSPTGPFTPVTGNLGHSIDGSVFIEDDGSWYFYSADWGGIRAAKMDSPTSIGESVLLPGTNMGGWTEGPTVIKRNGIYYLTETGNHVLSPAYRINVVTNTEGPMKPFTQGNNNPIMLSTEGDHVGLGHSSSFRGPDLDTYYMVYHNLNGETVERWPDRRLNFDAIGWNGDKMVVYGPTNWSMQDPALPDFQDRFERAIIGPEYSNNGGTWGISDNFLTQSAMGSSEPYIQYENTFTTASDYTAEFNVQEVSKGELDPKIGAVYGYVDDRNYGVAVLNSDANQLETNIVVDGEWGTQVNTSLPSGFDLTKLHTIRIEKSGSTYKYFVDNMLKETKTNAKLGAGKIGYLSADNEAKFGYIAASNRIDGSGIFDFHKPIPGTIQAVHYNSGGEGVGYHENSFANSGGEYRRNDKVDIRDNAEGGHHISWNTAGEWYKYNINVKADGTYNLGMRYATTFDNAQVRVWLDSTDVTDLVTLPNTGGWDNWKTYTIKGLNLTLGNHTLKVETIAGEFDFYTLQFNEADNSFFTITDNFDTSFSNDWNWSGGNWTIENGAASINNVGKRTLGSAGWSDYTIETDIKGANDLNSGIIFRVQNPAQGGDGGDAGLGTDFYQGYLACLSRDGITLGKQNYDWNTLKTVPGKYDLDTWYHMKVVVNGNNIKIFVEDMDDPVIDYTDNNNPFITGKVGLRAHYAHSLFDNFSVTNPATTLTPPTVTADTTDNDDASMIDITFTDDAAWRGAITAVMDGTTNLQTEMYTVSEGKITFKAGVLAAGSHTITIKATNYSDVTFGQDIQSYEPPTLTPPSVTTDTTNNDAVSAIDITFTDDAAWRGAITAVMDGTTALPTETYTVSEGKITFKAGVLAVGSHTITIKATNYSDVTFIQSVTEVVKPGGNGGGSTAPSGTLVKSTDGKLTLPVGSAGEVSLNKEASVSIPTDASSKELKITITKVIETQNLLTNQKNLASPIFEILKNFTENFNKPVSLTIAFDKTSIRGDQRVALFSYNEEKKEWVEVPGGKVNDEFITVDVNNFTKYAVFVLGSKLNLSDITGHWAEVSIKQALSGGIVKGYPDGTFKPNHTVTRAEFAVMLMNILKPQGEGTQLNFTDSTEIGAWAQEAVALAVRDGILHGYKDGSFRPQAEITRTEMAAVMARALSKSIEGNTVTDFADDEDIAVWAKDSVAFVKQAGIMEGKGDNQFHPQEKATRAEAVTVLLKVGAYKNK